MTWVLDLDGVVWRGGRPIPGSAAAVARLRGEGCRVAFLTNNAEPVVDRLVERLAAAGIAAEPSDVLTSAMAAALLVEPGERVLACAGPGVVEALEERGAVLVERSPADVVVVGRTTAFDHDLLARAARALHAGARLVATNEDPTYPVEDGLDPGAGAILAAVATAGRAVPSVAGKPHAPMAALVRERVGDVDVVVGDLPATDGALASRLGVPFALVLSGVTDRGAAQVLDPPPSLVAEDLREAVDVLLDLRGYQGSS